MPRPDDVSILVVRRSISAVAGHEIELATSFYSHLFAMAPGVRTMFPADMAFQTERLCRALVAAVRAMHDPDSLQPLLRQLGGDHAARYAVTDDMYVYVGHALVRAVREVLAGEWTTVTSSAWVSVYQWVAAEMIEGARLARVNRSGAGLPASAGDSV